MAELTPTEHAWLAHDALHKDDPATAHGELHLALGLPPEDGLPASAVTPPPNKAAFDADFRELCLKHDVAAAFLLHDGSRLLSGGQADLSAFIDRCAAQAPNRAQRRARLRPR